METKKSSSVYTNTANGVEVVPGRKNVGEFEHQQDGARNPINVQSEQVMGWTVQQRCYLICDVNLCEWL